MASEFAPNFIKNDEKLKKRFPPRELARMGSGLCWEPPKVHAKTMQRYRRNMAREAEPANKKRPQIILPSVDESMKIPEAVRRAAAGA
jgi:hypothetical protein